MGAARNESVGQNDMIRVWKAGIEKGNMMNVDIESLIEETAKYLGITSDEQKTELRPYVESAVELCAMQTGQQDFTSCEAAKRFVIYGAAQMYADRFGELNNKEGSATAQMMRNISFALQTKNRMAANDESIDIS